MNKKLKTMAFIGMIGSLALSVGCNQKSDQKPNPAKPTNMRENEDRWSKDQMDQNGSYQENKGESLYQNGHYNMNRH